MSALTHDIGANFSYLARPGEGTPVVLLHGIGSNARSFEPLIAALGPHRRVVAWDAPGYGESTPLAVDWPGASDYAVAVKRLLAHLGIARCVLVGHSLGTLIAARFAVLSPEQVATLCLISPSLGGAAEKGAPLPPAVARRVEDLDRLGPEQFAATRSPLLLADPAGRPDVLEGVVRAMAAVRRPGYDQAARMLATGRMLEDAAKITVPTAVVIGTQDRITPPANAGRVFAALAPSVRLGLFEIADAGHAVCQEQSAEVARAIAAIVDNKAAAHA
jgi:pimeloyl-ACP methyl ester carboxylesterase